MSKIEITYKPLERGTILEALPLLLEEDLRLLQSQVRRGFAAAYGRKFVGVLLYSVREKYLVVDRIEVLPQYQRFGIGTGMLEMLCKFADAMKYELVFSFEGESKFDPFYRFVASTGLFHIEKQAGFEAVLQEKELKELVRKYPHEIGGDIYFFDQREKVREEFLKQMEVPYPEIAEEIRNNNGAYSRKLCCCSVSGGQIQAACFMKDHGVKMELKLLYSLPERGILAAKALLQSVANLDQRNLVPVHVAPTGEIAVKILNGLCTSYRVETHFFMAYYLGKSEARR